MFDWLSNNKEWIFSGLGIFLIASIIQIVSLINRKKDKIDKQLDRIADRYMDVLDGRRGGHSGIPGLI